MVLQVEIIISFAQSDVKYLRRKNYENYENLLLFTRCATGNTSRPFKSPLAMGRDAFKLKHASSVSISGVIDTGVNGNRILIVLNGFSVCGLP